MIILEGMHFLAENIFTRVYLGKIQGNSTWQDIFEIAFYTELFLYGDSLYRKNSKSKALRVKLSSKNSLVSLFPINITTRRNSYDSG